MREPRPAAIRIAQELFIDEFEHDAAARRVRDFGIDARRREQGIFTAGIELEDHAQPVHEPLVVEQPVGKRVAASEIEALQVKHGEASARFALAEACEAEYLGRRRRRQILCARRQRGLSRAQRDLNREARRQKDVQPWGYRRKRAFVARHRLRRWKSKRPAAITNNAYAASAASAAPYAAVPGGP